MQRFFLIIVLTAGSLMGFSQNKTVISGFPASTADQLKANLQPLDKFNANDWNALLAQGSATDSASSVQWEYTLRAASDRVMLKGKQKARKQLEQAYVLALSQPVLTNRKHFIIEQLQLIGTDKSVPALGALVSDPSSSDPATRALASIGSRKAGKQLLSHLPNAAAPVQMAIVTALGNMRYRQAAAKLASLASGADKTLASLAMSSLEKMGAEKQIESIQTAQHLAILKEKLNGRSAPEGFRPAFNGKDLSGWKGLVADPVKRSKMTPQQLQEAQTKADSSMRSGWKVANGLLVFTGHGDNLCTVKQYGDFEMLVDWKITKDGDAGIYLRGTPQVQIWDTARKDVGADVGSGGLYNNQKNTSKPIVLADKAIGDWNSFHIIMKGDKVTVYLNNTLVTDNVPLENYWDRSQPIFPKEQIELQAHGTYVAYRNIYIKEL